MCDRTFPGKMERTGLLIPDEEPMTAKHRQHQSPTWWTVSFNWDYLQEYGCEVIYSSRNGSKVAASSKPIPVWVTANKSWGPGACHTACRKLNRLDSILPRCLVWSKCLPGSGWSQSLLWNFFEILLCRSASLGLGGHLAFLVYFDREGPTEFGKFQGLPETFFSCLPFCLRSFRIFYRTECFSIQETVTQQVLWWELN